jgi:hypothetical protein
MNMGHQKEDLGCLAFLSYFGAQSPDPGAGIDNDPATAGQRNLKASGITALEGCLCSRYRYGSACAPKLDLHKNSPVSFK